MKSLKLIFVSCLLVSMLMSCSSTKQLAIGVVEPARVQVPQNMKRIGVVKSISSLSEEEAFSSGIAKLVSRDDDFLTEKGVDAAMDGLLNKLLEDPRFDTILRLPQIGEFIMLDGGKPTEASWDNIRSFCERFGLDALFSLDYYQADTRLTLRKTRIHERDLMRAEVAKKGHELTLETLIENGWKIYDPFQELVLDEFYFKDQIIARGTGSSPIRAYHSIGTLRDSLVVKSRGSGDALGSRLQPSERTIYRSYYSTGSEAFVAAQKKIQEEDWEGAIVLWKEELGNIKKKLKAMSCHNLAVVYEYLDDLEEARSWAEKAYEYKPGKKSRDYISELEQRIVQNLEVAEQLSFLGR
ncbi:DUF6340 family protein [Lentiprolixibacter aurantiacus]|uniref:DUF6340 family protein n=1 Tax=Lentiprolixibacter aurantiacus TaxID=2993939 RepID=A0AAE3MLJ2_9FLAO|nr:DUF6340 family protein [Lentiprolixibacter aurantiacus]MCX2719659.1 DUF6340 family protein [Lentiprolixibacter aurantiacus]